MAATYESEHGAASEDASLADSVAAEWPEDIFDAVAVEWPFDLDEDDVFGIVDAEIVEDESAFPAEALTHLRDELLEMQMNPFVRNRDELLADQV
jgi:hypothetical protein